MADTGYSSVWQRPSRSPPLQCFVTRTGSVARFLPGVIFHPVLSDIQRARQIILFLLRLCDFRAVSCFLNHIS